MNKNTGGNVVDITSEVEMVDKLQNVSLFVQNIKMNIMKYGKDLISGKKLQLLCIVDS